MNAKSKVTTKKGDKGYTCMWSKEIISKDDVRVECLGQIDQLIAWIGIIYDEESHTGRDFLPILVVIQEILSQACSEIMSTGKKAKPINKVDVKFLDTRCKNLEHILEFPTHWWFRSDYGKNASKFNYARALTRNCERQVVKVLNETELNNINLIKFFNRLSDFFYLLTLFIDGRIKNKWK